MTQFWERCIKLDGSYVLEKTDNLEAFSKASGDDFLIRHWSQDYKIHVSVKGRCRILRNIFVLTDCVVNYDKTLMPYFRWSANSVTRCENKKLPQFPQKLRKCGHSSFDYKSDAFQKAHTDFQIFGLLR